MSGTILDKGSVPPWRGIILLKMLDAVGEYSSTRVGNYSDSTALVSMHAWLVTSCHSVILIFADHSSLCITRVSVVCIIYIL